MGLYYIHPRRCWISSINSITCNVNVVPTFTPRSTCTSKNHKTGNWKIISTAFLLALIIPRLLLLSWELKGVVKPFGFAPFISPSIRPATVFAFKLDIWGVSSLRFIFNSHDMPKTKSSQVASEGLHSPHPEFPQATHGGLPASTSLSSRIKETTETT